MPSVAFNGIQPTHRIFRLMKSISRYTLDFRSLSFEAYIICILFFCFRWLRDGRWTRSIVRDGKKSPTMQTCDKLFRSAYVRSIDGLD